MESEKIELQKKVVLLGNTEVGKTSIFNRVISGNYFEEGVSSSSAYFRSKVIVPQSHPNVTLKINLWDTAGQEKFHSLTEMYIREAHGVLIVYDMTSSTTFEAVENWYKMIDNHLDPTKVVIAMVGNKCDHHEMF